MAGNASTKVRQPRRRSAFPDWIDPMLATLTDRPFSDPEWIFERKLDGVRLLAFRRGGAARLLTRNRKRRVHYVSPRLVAEVAFTEWTGDDKLRHPRFVGLRSDKRPAEVVKETPS